MWTADEKLTINKLGPKYAEGVARHMHIKHCIRQRIFRLIYSTKLMMTYAPFTQHLTRPVRYTPRCHRRGLILFFGHSSNFVSLMKLKREYSWGEQGWVSRILARIFEARLSQTPNNPAASPPASYLIDLPAPIAVIPPVSHVSHTWIYAC